MMPAIAPDAPRVGVTESGSMAIWASEPDQSASEIDDQVANRSQHLLDVVAHDPEIKHVSDQVHPAPVQKHRRQQRPAHGNRTGGVPEGDGALVQVVPRGQTGREP